MFYSSSTLLLCGVPIKPIMQVMFTAQKIKFSIKGFFTKLAKPAGNCGFGHIYSRNPQWKTSFFVRFFLNILDNSNYCLDKTWWNNSDRRIKGGKLEEKLEKNDLSSQRRRASTFTHSGEMKMTDFNRKNREEGYEILLLSWRLALTSEQNFKQCSILYLPEKVRKTRSFLKFPRGVEVEH